MSNEQHLPGYSVEDDYPHSESVLSSQHPTAESERADDPVFTTSAGDGDVIPAPQSSTEPTPTTTSPQQQQQQFEDSATAATPPLPQRPPVDEFADPKIAPLHAIFPDFDAAIL
jgi:hypothetical protein